jgi:hypothetical protein
MSGHTVEAVPCAAPVLRQGTEGQGRGRAEGKMGSLGRKVVCMGGARDALWAGSLADRIPGEAEWPGRRGQRCRRGVDLDHTPFALPKVRHRKLKLNIVDVYVYVQCRLCNHVHAAHPPLARCLSSPPPTPHPPLPPAPPPRSRALDCASRIPGQCSQPGSPLSEMADIFSPQRLYPVPYAHRRRPARCSWRLSAQPAHPPC